MEMPNNAGWFIVLADNYIFVAPVAIQGAS